MIASIGVRCTGICPVSHARGEAAPAGRQRCSRCGHSARPYRPVATISTPAFGPPHGRRGHSATVPGVVVTLTASHVGSAGALLAARHATERARWPLLPHAPTDPAVATSLVAQTLRFADGVAAVDDGGGLLGFLTGFEATTDQASPMARYSPERAAL